MDGVMLSGDVMPMRWATSATLSMPTAISNRTKPVFDDTSKARAMLRVP